MKKILLVGGMLFYFTSSFSQESNANLLFQYFGIDENQFEINYIASILENNHISESDRNSAIIEAHEYYIAHKEEIQTTIKANELIMFRDAVKKAKSAAWSQVLTAMATTIATSMPAAIEAGNQQQIEYQEKLNRDRDIQAYVARHSSNTPKQYTQNFGNTPVGTNTTTRPRVTTSNGYDTPLPSASYNKSSSIDLGRTSVNSNEQIIQAVYVSGNQLVACRLQYNSGHIWAYSTSKNPLGQENWISIQVPETPTPTMSIRDGDKAKDYKYTISGAGMKFYFNM